MTDSLTAHRRRVPAGARPGRRSDCGGRHGGRDSRACIRPARKARRPRARPAPAGPGRTCRSPSRWSRSSTSTEPRSGSPACRTTQALTDSAAWKASHMANYGYFDHNDPAPPVARDPFTRMTDCGYSAGGAEGENIAFGQTDANDVMNAWLNSPGHKANIEQPSFRSIGVGARPAAANGQIYWVQDFAGGVSSGAPPRPRRRRRPRHPRRRRPRPPRLRQRRQRRLRHPSRRRRRLLRSRRPRRLRRAPVRRTRRQGRPPQRPRASAARSSRSARPSRSATRGATRPAAPGW